MIDIHSHCLPNIDDGSKSIEQSLEMLTESYRQGVRTVAATPHCFVHNEADIKKFLDKRDKAQKHLEKHVTQDIPAMLLGAEVYLDNDISKYENVDLLCIGNTKYMLVEICEDISPEKTADIIYSLILKDIHPIIAHIDRYDNWYVYGAAFSEFNVVYQLNSVCFLSFKGRAFVSKFISIESNIVVGSDMHNTTLRPPTMAKAYKKAKSKYGAEIADSMFDNKQIELF